MAGPQEALRRQTPGEAQRPRPGQDGAGAGLAHALSSLPGNRPTSWSRTARPPQPQVPGSPQAAHVCQHPVASWAAGLPAVGAPVRRRQEAEDNCGERQHVNLGTGGVRSPAGALCAHQCASRGGHKPARNGTKGDSSTTAAVREDEGILLLRDRPSHRFSKHTRLGSPCSPLRGPSRPVLTRAEPARRRGNSSPRARCSHAPCQLTLTLTERCGHYPA